VRLADAWGVAASYRGHDGTRRRVSTDALIGVLRALGAPIEGPADAPEALRARLADRRARMLEPVMVAWGEDPPAVDVRTGATGAGDDVSFEVQLDDGTAIMFDGGSCLVELVDHDDDAGGETTVRRYTFPRAVPHGAHRIRCRAGGREGEAVLLSAPLHAHQLSSRRGWGVFAPVYALRTHRNDPLPGDLGDLSALANWAAGLGAAVVGTLPLLSAFLDEPYEPSPYSPVSRRFWNELYVQTDTPLAATNGDGLIDLRGAFGQKRRALEACAARGEHADVVEAYAARRPDIERYARFRAAVEQHGADWASWPASWRFVGIPEAAVDATRVRYHRYAQALADDQIGALAARLRAQSQALYLDFPLGTHPAGFDVWDEPGLFVDGARVGAPPDQFFSGGQDWGFPPTHPEAGRADGHRYFAASIDHHLERAGLLRVDHVMGLHRLWWIPPGHGAADGAFVRYPSDELYARLCLASERHGAALIGENLGTVPPEVNRALRRHRIGGMHVVQFEIDADAPGGVRAPAAGALTALDTHDTATFAAFWGRTPDRASVVQRLRDAGLLAHHDDDRGDEPDARTVMTALLELLGSSRAQLVLVSLEDLWSEMHPQNVPGTVAPENWRRPAALSLDELAHRPELVDTLRRLAAARTGNTRPRARARARTKATHK
jgi:4-alpha-glucanotransferase